MYRYVHGWKAMFAIMAQGAKDGGAINEPKDEY